MKVLNFLASAFLLPGNLVLAAIHVTASEDSGILRSMVNMIFWGFIAFIVALPFMI